MHNHGLAISKYVQKKNNHYIKADFQTTQFQSNLVK